MDVRIHLFFFAARGAEVDDPDVCFASFAKEDILGFEIAVNDPLLLKKDEAGEELA